MFNFLGKNDYTSKCTKILNKETGLDPLIAQAFIEDFKPIFDGEYSKNNNPEEIVQGVFALKHLVMFTKCTNLSNQVEIYLKNDYPLIISYGVASLGNIKLCLAPQQFDD